MSTKLPRCTCRPPVPDGCLCGCCHAGLEIPKDYYPELAKSIDGKEFTGGVQQKAGSRLPDLADKRLGENK
ncbi:hypothetical protein fHeYen801_111 [Yersinia phage fHe-Yen8-01]|nr:hypothetical protein fHeYen801_111 [Yersinia phage fHe-Yen8-01]